MGQIMEQKQQRDYLFDNIKAVLIYLVVIGHLMSPREAPSIIYKVIYYFAYSFHMPAFIFIAGYFSKNLDKCRETAVKNFLVPYVVIDFSSYLVGRILEHGTITLKNYEIFEPKLGCWFLMAMFVWKLLLKDMVRIRFSVVLLFIFGLVAGFSNQFSNFMSLGRIVGFSGFFVLGYFAEKKHVDMIRKIPKWLSIGALLGIIWLAYYCVVYNVMPRGPLLFREPYRNNSDIIFRFILYIIALLMIVISINLASTKKTILSIIGQRTITVYIIHLFIVRILDQYDLFQDNNLAYAIYIFGGGLFITYLCSRNWVINGYNSIMNGINKLVFKSESTK